MSQRLLGFLLLLIASTAHAEIQTQVIEYPVGAARMTGYLAYDDAINGPRPGVLVVHEWWGHNAYARKRAEMLAQLGYTAFAVDMYGDGKVADRSAYRQTLFCSSPISPKNWRPRKRLACKRGTSCARVS